MIVIVTFEFDAYEPPEWRAFDLEGFSLETFLELTGVGADRVVVCYSPEHASTGQAFESERFTEYLARMMPKSRIQLAKIIGRGSSSEEAQRVWALRPEWRDALDFWRWARELTDNIDGTIAGWLDAYRGRLDAPGQVAMADLWDDIANNQSAAMAIGMDALRSSEHLPSWAAHAAVSIGQWRCAQSLPPGHVRYDILRKYSQYHESEALELLYLEEKKCT